MKKQKVVSEDFDSAERVESVVEPVVKKSAQDIKFDAITRVREEEDNFVESALGGRDYVSLVSNCYSKLDVAVDMVLMGISYGSVIEGSAGTGKTFRVESACKKYKDNNSKFVYRFISGFTTPQALFIKLYQERNVDVIILDDVAGIFSNPKQLAFFKSALWENFGDERALEYLTTKPMEDEFGRLVPRRFPIKARIIVVTNYIPKNEDVNAVLSRVNHVILDIPRAELLNIMEQVVKHNNKFDLTYEEKMECLDYLKRESDECTEHLDIRTLIRIFQFRDYAKRTNRGDAWMTYSGDLLNRDERWVIVKNLLEDNSFESEHDRVNKFIELTVSPTKPKGESKATYYRLKEIVKNRLKKVVETRVGGE